MLLMVRSLKNPGPQFVKFSCISRAHHLSCQQGCHTTGELNNFKSAEHVATSICEGFALLSCDALSKLLLQRSDM